MSLISITKTGNVLPEFVEQRLMPSAPPAIKFCLGAALPFAVRKVEGFAPELRMLGLADEQNRIDIDKAREALAGGFSKTESLSAFGFTFTREDGDALLGIMDKYKD